MAETLLPTSLVPGLVTVEDQKGNQRNVYPIDAKDLIASGEFKLVDNGSAEAARLNINPLRTDRYSGDPRNVVAEVTGIAGVVVEARDEKTAQKIIKAGDTADARPGPSQLPQDQTDQRAAESAKDAAKTAAPAKADDKK